uniref:Uncharacterized protein n=1 Tax=Zea mays TaxID=4577 RepID=B8A057_MAIZE|nr:unknown [Zea mays]
MPAKLEPPNKSLQIVYIVCRVKKKRITIHKCEHVLPQSMWQRFIWSEQELLLEKRHAVLWLVLGVAHRLVRLLLLLLLLLVVVRVIRVRRAHRVAEPGQGEAASLRGRHRRALVARGLLWRHLRRQRGAVERGAAARRGHVVVVLALVRGDHRARVVARALHVLPHQTPCPRALVVAPRVRVALDDLLPVLAPPVAVVQDVDVAHRLHDNPRLPHRPVVAGHRHRAPCCVGVATVFPPSLGVGFIVVEIVGAEATAQPRAHAVDLVAVAAEGPGRVLRRHHGCSGQRAPGMLGHHRVAGALHHVRRRRRAGAPARTLRLRVVVRALVHDLRDLAVRRLLHLLLGGAAREAALVVAARVLAPLHLLLPVLAPVVPVVRRRAVALPLLAEAGSRAVAAAGAEHVASLRRRRLELRRRFLVGPRLLLQHLAAVRVSYSSL